MRTLLVWDFPSGTSPEKSREKMSVAGVCFPSRGCRRQGSGLGFPRAAAAALIYAVDNDKAGQCRYGGYENVVSPGFRLRPAYGAIRCLYEHARTPR